MATEKTEPVLEELRPGTVPGSRKYFFIAVIIAAAYLTLIFVTSPGKVEKNNHPKTGTTPAHVQP